MGLTPLRLSVLGASVLALLGLAAFSVMSKHDPAKDAADRARVICQKRFPNDISLMQDCQSDMLTAEFRKLGPDKLHRIFREVQ